MASQINTTAYFSAAESAVWYKHQAGRKSKQQAVKKLVYHNFPTFSVQMCLLLHNRLVNGSVWD